MLDQTSRDDGTKRSQMELTVPQTDEELIALYHEEQSAHYAAIPDDADAILKSAMHAKFARTIRELSKGIKDARYTWHRFASPLANWFSTKPWLQNNVENHLEDYGEINEERPNGSARNIIRSVKELESDFANMYNLLHEASARLDEAHIDHAGDENMLMARIQRALHDYDQKHRQRPDFVVHKSQRIHVVEISATRCPSCSQPGTINGTVPDTTPPLYVFSPCGCRVSYVMKNTA